MMRYFYSLLLYCTQLELAYFKKHVHSQKHINALISDESSYERALWNLGHPLHLSR